MDSLGLREQTWTGDRDLGANGLWKATETGSLGMEYRRGRKGGALQTNTQSAEVLTLKGEVKEKPWPGRQGCFIAVFK